MSTLGAGSTFSVYLPVSTAAEASELAAETQVYRGEGQTILLADDDPAVLEAHRSILAGLGYHVLVAADGLEAVAKLDEAGTEIRLAILDVVMPQMNGIIAARTMRARHPELKVMFLSAHDAERDLPAHLRRDQEVMLGKPCPVPLLSRTVMQQMKG